MKCADCKDMKVVSIEDGCGAAAKCFNNSKRGKTITWAMTTLSVSNSEKEDGKDRVIAELNKKQIAPFWCPNRKTNN